MSSFKLPNTVGPWFTYWIEYIPATQLGRAEKKWFKETIEQVMHLNSFGRVQLDSVSADSFKVFLQRDVKAKFSKREAAMLEAYFHSAMVAAKNLGGANSFVEEVKKDFLTWRQYRKFLAAFSILFMFYVSSMTLIRMVDKKEDSLTASATVLRESGFGIAVAFAEDVYYNYLNPAKVGGLPSAGPNDDNFDSSAVEEESGDALVANLAAWGVAKSPSALPTKLKSPVFPIDGEGEWKATKIRVNGNTAIWVARIRPDTVHTSYWATITWLDPKLLAFTQVPGTKIPEVNGLTDRSGQVSSSLKPFYVAGLNGGFLLRDSQGGYQLGDRIFKKLVPGKASLVTYNDGSFDVVEWGRDSVRRNIQSIRQNMELIVDGGVSQVEAEDQSKWGWVWQGVGSGKNLVWRSAIGIRADGTMVYVIGEAMSAKSLGDVLVRAGAQRAILLDMNSAYANGFLYGPYKNGKKLDSASTRSPERFLIPSERDFLAVFAKSPATKAN